MTDPTPADTWPAPFPEREHHSNPCPGCGHLLGVHCNLGCLHGWIYDPVTGDAEREGCECPLSLAATHLPPHETDL